MRYSAYISILILLSWPAILSADWTIQHVNIEPLDQRELVLSMLPLREEALYDDELRDLSVRLLQSTGRFKSIAIRGDESSKSVFVQLTTWDYLEETHWLVSSEVASSIDTRCLSPNETASMPTDRFQNLQKCFQESLRGEGFLDADISLVIEGKTLLVKGHLGPRYKIAKVSFVGAETLRPEFVLDRVRNEPGKFLNGTKLADDTRRIMRNLLEDGRFFAEVFEPRIEKRGEGLVEIIWKIKESYPIDLQFTGQRRSRDKIRELIDREMTFPQWYLDEIVEGLKNELVSEGYLEGTVSVRHDLDAKGGEHIEVNTKQGPRYYVLKPQWIGTQNTKEMELAAKGIFEIQSGQPYREQQYRDLMEGEFLNRLMSHGYLDARVRDVDFSVDRGRKRVFPLIYVSEGDQYVVDEAVIDGFPKEFSRAQQWLDFRKAVQPGAVIDLLRLDEAQKDLQRYLISLGYLDAKIDRGLHRQRARVKIVTKIITGPRYRVARVLIRGAVKTDYKILQNEIVLKPGDFFEEEVVRESVSQVLRLGLARSVDIQAVEKDERAARVFAVVDIVEAARYRFEVGPGYGTNDGLRGVFRATWANIGGRGRRLSLYTKASRRFTADSPSPADVYNYQELPLIQRRVTVEYFEPSLFNLHMDGRLNYTHSKDPRDNLFGERNSFSGAIDYRWSRRWILTNFYELAFSEPFNVSRDDVENISGAKGKRFTSVGQTFLVDFLDDSFSPTRGFRSRVEASLYNRQLGGEVDMWQATFKHEFFHALYTLRKGRSVGFALGVSAGFSDFYGATDAVPVEKRLRVGGENSVRAFSEGGIKPKLPNGKYQDGGNSFLSFMSELHIPLAGDIDFLFFFDGGRAFLENSDFRPWGLRLGAGPGLRFNTPVGPLKLGYGFVLFHDPGEPTGTFYLGVGAI